MPNIEVDRSFHGDSLVPLARGEPNVSWRKELFYEYFWNWVFPHTPTVFALRTDDYKLIQYHGIWDTDELYNLRDDPREMHNLIADPAHRDRVRAMRERLFELNAETGGEPEVRLHDQGRARIAISAS